MPSNIFIDTSTFLSFYAVSNDDLEQLEKIIGLIADNQIKIFITAQVQREWVRNRDNKLAEAIAAFEKSSIKLPSIPRFMLEYDDISDLRKALTIADRARSAAVERAKLEASSANTNADKFIQRIFSAAGIEGDDPEVTRRAEHRMAIGDLPGKPGSLGDRLNWEHLLASELTDGDLHIISRDGDFFSPLDDKLPRYALYKEWVEKKNGKLFVHHEIKPFLSSKFPQFKFKPHPQARDGAGSPRSISLAPYTGAADRWTASRLAAFEDLEQAEDAEGLELAIERLEKLLPYLDEADLLRICKFAARSDVFHDYLEAPQIYTFFENLIPRIYHLLDRKDIEALEQTFDIELHPEEFQPALGEEADPLAPDYGQMDLDLLAEQADQQLEAWEIGQHKGEPYDLDDDLF